MRKKLIKIFESVGLYGDYDSTLEIDSLQFISIIIEMENEFGVNIEDTVVFRRDMNKLDDFIGLLTDLGVSNDPD